MPDSSRKLNPGRRTNTPKQLLPGTGERLSGQTNRLCVLCSHLFSGLSHSFLSGPSLGQGLWEVFLDDVRRFYLFIYLLVCLFIYYLFIYGEGDS